MTETRDTILLAEALSRNDALAAALDAMRKERDAARRVVVWDRATLGRQRALRMALCLSVATSGILLMRISTLPPPVRPPQVLPRAAAARPANMTAPMLAPVPAYVFDPLPRPEPRPVRPALPQVQRPD